MHADQIRAIVDRLEAHVSSRRRFQLHRIDDRPPTLDEAYAIQAEIVERALRSGSESIAGYKVGLTTEKMQKFCGVTEPIAGRIFKSGVRASGVQLRKADFHRLGIESEMALRIGKEVPVIAANGNVGEQIATGSSSDVMSGPLSVLAWVARFVRELGHELRPGQWIMTGSIIPTRFAVEGDTYAFQLGPLPPVTVTIR